MPTSSSILPSWHLQDEPDTKPLTPDDIDNAPNEVVVSGSDTLVSESDLRRALSQVGLEKDAIQAKLENTERRVRTIEILDELIEPYARRSFIFMCAYCGVVGLILLLNGFTGIAFTLPENVLTFLVGSTATTVIGLVGMVLTGIFVGARPKKD